MVLSENEVKDNYDAIVLAVSHNEFLNLDIDSLKSENSVVFDVKSLFPKERVDARL